MSTPADPSVEIETVTKRFGEVTAVDDVSLQIRRGELFSLLGPSGCGKTTLLRLIAGFEEPSAGTIRIHGSCGASRCASWSARRSSPCASFQPLRKSRWR